MMINLMSLCGVENALSSFFIGDHLTFPDLLQLFRSPISHLLPTRYFLQPPSQLFPHPNQESHSFPLNTALRQRLPALTPEFFCCHASLPLFRAWGGFITYCKLNSWGRPIVLTLPHCKCKVRLFTSHWVQTSLVLRAFWGTVVPRAHARLYWNQRVFSILSFTFSFLPTVLSPSLPSSLTSLSIFIFLLPQLRHSSLLFF